MAIDLESVRLHLGDLDDGDRLFSDDVILAALEQYGRPYRAAYHLALAKAAQFARRTNRSIDGLTVNYSDISRQFYELADRLMKESDLEGLSAGAGLYVGGLSRAEKELNRLSDRVQPRFRTRQFRNPEGSSRTDGDDGWCDRHGHE